MYYNSLEGIVTFEAIRFARTPPLNPPPPTLHKLSNKIFRLESSFTL